MINFFVRNALLVHILLLAVAYSWIHGGTRPDLLLPVIPWLTAFMVECLLVFPQARVSETLAEARSRVCRALVRDPLFYLFLALTVLLVLPFFNVTGSPEFNVTTGEWRIPPPPKPSMPFCVDPAEHAVLLLWFIPVLLAALAAKHGLLKKGKRMLLAGFCWNGAALALLGFIQLATGTKSIFWGGEELPAYFFATFGYPNFAGAFFTLLFAISVGLWFGRVNEDTIGPSASTAAAWADDGRRKASPHWLLIPVLLNLCAAIASLSRAAILLCGVVAVALGVYMVIGAWQTSTTGRRVQLVASIVGVLLVAALSLTILAPKALTAELLTITPEAISERVSGRGQYHARVAKAIFDDHPVFGVGGWGYPHYLQLYITPEERKSIQITGGANVHNDTLQFLAEQGAIGFGLLALCALAVLLPLIWQAGRVNHAMAVAGEESGRAKPRWLYRMPPEMIAVLVGAIATVCHSLGDLPFRSPAVLMVWMLAFVCATGFLPAVRIPKKTGSKKNNE